MANHEFRSEESPVPRPENSGKHTAWLMVQLEKELQGVDDPVRVAALQEHFIERAATWGSIQWMPPSEDRALHGAMRSTRRPTRL